MITVDHTCAECGLEDTIEVTLPRGRNPENAGSINPAECCACGTEFDRKSFFDAARDLKPEDC